MGRARVLLGISFVWAVALGAPAALGAEPPATRPAPAPECLAAVGQIACGWGCVAAYGQVRCASEPNGVCHAAYGQIACSGPGGAPPDRAAPRARCHSAYGKIACGWGCVAAYGEVRCAGRPGGVCRAAYGRIACSP